MRRKRIARKESKDLKEKKINFSRQLFSAKHDAQAETKTSDETNFLIKTECVSETQITSAAKRSKQPINTHKQTHTHTHPNTHTHKHTHITVRLPVGSHKLSTESIALSYPRRSLKPTHTMYLTNPKYSFQHCPNQA